MEYICKKCGRHFEKEELKRGPNLDRFHPKGNETLRAIAKLHSDDPWCLKCCVDWVLEAIKDAPALAYDVMLRESMARRAKLR